MGSRLVLAVLAAMALNACATAAKYEATLNSWIGHSESELVAAWGPPAGVYVAPDGSRILTYNEAGNMYLPGTEPTYTSTVIGNTVYTTSYGGVPARNIALSCQTNFTIVNGAIRKWSYQGNNCISQ